MSPAAKENKPNGITKPTHKCKKAGHQPRVHPAATCGGGGTAAVTARVVNPTVSVPDAGMPTVAAVVLNMRRGAQRMMVREKHYIAAQLGQLFCTMQVECRSCANLSPETVRYDAASRGIFIPDTTPTSADDALVYQRTLIALYYFVLTEGHELPIEDLETTFESAGPTSLAGMSYPLCAVEWIHDLIQPYAARAKASTREDHARATSAMHDALREVVRVIYDRRNGEGTCREWLANDVINARKGVCDEFVARGVGMTRLSGTGDDRIRVLLTSAARAITPELFAHGGTTPGTTATSNLCGAYFAIAELQDELEKIEEFRSMDWLWAVLVRSSTATSTTPRR